MKPKPINFDDQEKIRIQRAVLNQIAAGGLTVSQAKQGLENLANAVKLMAAKNKGKGAL